jgi:uncharacterized membrane protein YcjF (UPF0283 family)
MWNWLVYAALIVGALAVLATVALLAVRVLQAWRSFKRLRRHVARELDRLADLGEATAAKVERATDTEELDRSVASLRVSLAQLSVLREALDEVSDTVGHVTGLVPQK